MPKAVFTYSSLTIASLVMVAGFITATSYAQLAAASILYPLLIFFAYKVLPLKAKRPALERPVVEKKTLISSYAKTQEEKRSHVGIGDIEKRAFLKLIGATGLSFFLISIFGRRIESLLFGQGAIPLAPIGSQPGGQIPTASPTDGYKITEIDNGLVGYYGFTNKDGGWLIMKEDTDSGSFRYTKGASNFPLSWNNRTNLKYDYFHNLSF